MEDRIALERLLERLRVFHATLQYLTTARPIGERATLATRLTQHLGALLPDAERTDLEEQLYTRIPSLSPTACGETIAAIEALHLGSVVQQMRQVIARVSAEDLSVDEASTLLRPYTECDWSPVDAHTRRILFAQLGRLVRDTALSPEARVMAAYVAAPVGKGISSLLERDEAYITMLQSDQPYVQFAGLLMLSSVLTTAARLDVVRRFGGVGRRATQTVERREPVTPYQREAVITLQQMMRRGDMQGDLLATAIVTMCLAGQFLPATERAELANGLIRRLIDAPAVEQAILLHGMGILERDTPLGTSDDPPNPLWSKRLLTLLLVLEAASDESPNVVKALVQSLHRYVALQLAKPVRMGGGPPSGSPISSAWRSGPTAPRYSARCRS